MPGQMAYPNGPAYFHKPIMDEARYLDPDWQLRSHLSPDRRAGASFLIPQVCHLCLEATSKGEYDEQVGKMFWICSECKADRRAAQNALRRMEK